MTPNLSYLMRIDIPYLVGKIVKNICLHSVRSGKSYAQSGWALPWIMTFKNNLYFSFLFRLLLKTSGKLCMPQKLCPTPKVLCFYVRLPMFLAGNWIMVELLWCGVEAVLFDLFFWEISRRLMKKIPSWTIFSWTISSKTLFMKPNLHGERFVNLICFFRFEI